MARLAVGLSENAALKLKFVLITPTCRHQQVEDRIEEFVKVNSLTKKLNWYKRKGT